MSAAAMMRPPSAIVLLCCFLGLGFLCREATAQEAAEPRYWRMTNGAIVLTAEQEKAIGEKPGAAFKECANGCPVMIAVPAGKFMMGAPESESGRDASERP